MDDGDIDEKFEYFCDHILPILGIDENDQDAIEKAYDEWLEDSEGDFYGNL